jgi:para-aminobenzoate synthetase/4-amino-4-deoxychorismate lyase
MVCGALLDFVDPHDAKAAPLRLAFGEPQEVLVAHTLGEVQAVLHQVQERADAGLWCVGYVRYEAAPAFDAALQVHKADGPLAWFAVHDAPQEWPQTGISTAPAAATASTAQWQPGIDRATFNASLGSIQRAIAAGELYQVNYTAPLQAHFKGNALQWFHALCKAQPQAYSAYIDTGNEQVLSVSPELFFDWDGRRILSRPMKGTAARGANAHDDAAAADALRASAKERAENVMIVDLIRNDVSRVAEPFSVQVPRLFHLQALPTVWQMTSDVVAQTRSGTTLWDVFKALFPCGSVTGAPKVQAMRHICSVEPQPRGVYCGAIGVVRPGGHATFNVAIRTVTVRGSVARCGIGSGITADATTDGEWQEWHAKRSFLERASQLFELLETLGLKNGHLTNAELHLARIQRAAHHFGFSWDVATAHSALDALVQTHASGVFRVRLLLNADGQAHAECFPLAATHQPVRLQLAAEPLQDAYSEFVRFKTTHRAHYDAFTPTDPQVFDTVLWNTAGEVTECTRGNIAVLLDGQWFTPAASCGLLAGVGRAVQLQHGRLQEAVIRVEDLARAQGFAFINSMRGWLSAELV